MTKVVPARLPPSFADDTNRISIDDLGYFDIQRVFCIGYVGLSAVLAVEWIAVVVVVIVVVIVGAARDVVKILFFVFFHKIVVSS